MSSSIPEIQQIPARHGTATFVPKGHVIKIINTYGRQVVDTWAFALPKAPSAEEMKGEEEAEEEVKRVEEEEKGKQESGEQQKEGAEEQEAQPETEGEASTGAEKEQEGEEQGNAEGEEQKGEDKAEDKVEPEEDGDKKDSGTSAQKVPGSDPETDGEKPKDSPAEASQKATPTKTPWSAYIPSIPRVRGKSTGEAAKTPQRSKEPAGEKRTWASYFPSGKGFSNYVPSSKSLSSFANSHYRDPTKSYAEQLYDFSKTPVGAGAISAATGSGYAGSAYAAYAAYAKQAEGRSALPPMEYLSMPHCHTATKHLIPRVSDTLVSNLRRPLLTVIEDTAACHDTLIAACDPTRYESLGVEKWEEHGSCAENLVLALKELNDKAGLKGSKAIGTDVTVNTVPPPLNLFMNIPWKEDGEVTFEAPKGKRGEFIRLKAERDVVVVMSACPMDVTPVNGGKCMAAHFVVQEPERKAAAAKRPAVKKTASSAKKVPQSTPQKAAAKPAATPAKAGDPVKRPSETNAPTARKPSQPNAAQPDTNGASAPGTPARRGSVQPAPKPGRAKPKKLQRKTESGTTQSSNAKA